MVLFQTMTMVFGVVMLLGTFLAAGAVLRVPRFRTRDSAFLLSVACIFGGPFVSATASPDWSPLTMFLGYVPFLCVGIWMARASSRRSKRAGSMSASNPEGPSQELSSRERRVWVQLFRTWLIVAALPTAAVVTTFIWDSVRMSLQLLFGRA